MLQINDAKITGVLNKNATSDNFNLRRYFPEQSLSDLVEQFWFVDWDLPQGQSHQQQNLPDPNCHLVVKEGSAKILGPVSSTFSYTMQGAGSIVGVKFVTGALVRLLAQDAGFYLDKEIDISELFAADSDQLQLGLSRMNTDTERVDFLTRLLTPLVSKDTAHHRIKQLVERVKTKPEITSVEALATHTDLSIRAIQRCFKTYLGLTPKWLIKRYRIHQALEMLEQGEAQIADIVGWLGYTDQSHLIHDFRTIVGTTPRCYKVNNR